MFTDREMTDRAIAARLGSASPWLRSLLALDRAHRRVASVPTSFAWRLSGSGRGAAPIPGHRWTWPIRTSAHGETAVQLERSDDDLR